MRNLLLTIAGVVTIGTMLLMLCNCNSLPSEKCPDFEADITSYIEYNKWGG